MASGPPAGMDLSENLGPHIIGADMALLALATIAVIVRFISRFLSKANFWWDDWVVALALIFAYGNGIMSVIAVKNGIGKHVWAPGVNIATVTKLLWLYEFFYGSVVPAVKMSIVLLYYRIFPVTWFRRVLYGISFLVLGWGIAIIVTAGFQCQPYDYFWKQYTDPTAEGSCIDVYAFFLSNGSLSVFTDFVILICPISMVWRLQMPMRRKLTVLGIFLLAGFACVAGVIRIYFLTQMYANDDLTWNQTNSFIWSSVEPCIGIICACLPTIRPLIRRMFPDWLGSGRQGLSTSPSYKSTSYHSSGKAFRPQDEEEIVLTNTFGKGSHVAPSDHTTISVERDVGWSEVSMPPPRSQSLDTVRSVRLLYEPWPLYSQTVDFLSDSLANPRSQLPLLAVTGASFTLGLLIRSLFSRTEHRQAVLLSPRASLLPSLSDAENRKLPLPNDVLPGARDVVSPYGSIRVYEWGPEDGPKVLLVHGITTPCIALGGLAYALVDRGCRVMLFDLFGRGYSDCPADLLQDERLFSTQILLALIRDSQISFKSRLLYSRGLMPENLLSFMVARRLRASPLVSPKPKSEKLNAADALTEELPSQNAGAVQILSREYPNINMPSVVACATTDGQSAHKVHILCGINDVIIIKDELVPDATAALGGNAVFKFYEAGHEFPSTKYEEVATYISETL
ncbi:hypothetical protein N7486_000613 [Penicillium sp. IBT 16267x]|nr:hypothetical protein N7486_000613 [Penicillium sp. IBT 16267x]